MQHNCSFLSLNLAEELCHIPVSLLFFLVALHCQLSDEGKMPSTKLLINIQHFLHKLTAWLPYSTNRR